MHACRNRPTHDPHVTHDPPCRAQGVGKHSRRKITVVKSAPPARASFWAWHNNVSRLCVAQARGLLSVYKSRGSPFDPFTCARTVGAAPTATLSKAGEGSRREAEAQDGQGNAKTKGTKEGEGEVDYPGKNLSRAACPNTNRASHPWAHGFQPNRLRLDQGSGGTSMVACRSLSRP